MAQHALFAGLVLDEQDRPVEVVHVGNDAFYVVNDAGFRRHILAEEVDRQVLAEMASQIQGHEDIVSEQTARMLGQEDLFTRAIILNQLKHLDQQIETLFQTGIPEDARAYLGMMGLRIIINLHGEVLEVRQPGLIADDDGDGE
jgi:hypothetical protein